MKNSIFIYLIIVLSAIMLSACSSEWGGNDVSEDDIYQFYDIDIPVTSDISFSDTESLINNEINTFGIRTLVNIINKIDGLDNQNIAFSPISAMMAMSVFHNTALIVYGYGLDLHSQISFDKLDDLNSTCNKLMRFLPYSQNSKCDISLANSVWLTNKVGPQPSLKDFLESQFYAELYRYDNNSLDNIVNSLNNINILRERVRKWIEIKTKREIPDYYLQGDETRSITFNVTYFKGEWLNKFDPNFTHKATFHSPAGDVVAEMMRSDFSRVAYWESESWEAVSLPFDGNYDMIFVLPSEDTALADAVPALGSCKGANCQYLDLTLSIPKFEIENFLDLSEDFGVNVGSNVRQITKIEVDENGAKAVAVTEVMDDILPQLVFDRPFLYAIVNKVTGTALMMGAVTTF